MKKQNIFRLSMLAFTMMAVSACSPFGNQSLIQDISNEIGIFIPGKTSTSVNSSASSTVTITCGPGPTQIPCPNGEAPGPDIGHYSVTHSVGDTFQAGNSVSATAGTAQHPTVSGVATGYTVFSSVSGDVQ